MGNAAPREKNAPPAGDLSPVGASFDFTSGRVTLSQRGQFEIRPREISMTFDTLELLWHQLHTASLKFRGLLEHVNDPRFALSNPSGGPSNPSPNPNGNPS